MHLVSKSEALHRKEHFAKRIANLCHARRYLRLPVEVPRINRYTKGILVGLTGKHLHIKFCVLEPDRGIVEPEVLCCVDKLRETWNGKRELLEKQNLQPFETRGRDPTNKCLRVSANASEPEEAKVSKCNVCRDWRMCGLPLHITVRNGEGLRKPDLETP